MERNRCWEDTYSVGQSHPNRKGIGVFDLLIVTKGSLYIGEGEDKYQVDSKFSLILYPNLHHYSFQSCNQETHFYWFHFTVQKEWGEISESTLHSEIHKENTVSKNPFSEFPFGIILPKFKNLLNWKEVENLCKQILETEKELSYTWEWNRQMLFQRLLQEIATHSDLSQMLPSLAVAEQAAAYIRKHYQSKISYEILGEELRFHPNHIARCMIRNLGITPIEYVNRVRIDHAKILLISKDWSIEMISERCGFSNSAYFSRLFKKLEGVSPNEFRKKLLENRQDI